MPQGRPAPERAVQAIWRSCLLRQRLAEPLLIILLTLLVVPRLPPGPCFDDAGDLQAAAALLGIAHPPGYPLLVCLGHVLTWLPMLSPAYAVTLGCWAGTLAALVLAVRIQQRLGVRPVVAATAVLLLGMHPSARNALFAPEVYGPSLALVLGAVLCLIRWQRDGKTSWMAATALLAGAAVASRPPLLLALPGFVVPAVLALRGGNRDELDASSATLNGGAQTGAAAIRSGLSPARNNRRGDTPVRSAPGRIAPVQLTVAGICFLLPLVLSAAYVCLRDVPGVSYNYIEQYRFETGALPDAAAGPAARLERSLWLLSGRQYGDTWVSSWPALRERARWVAHNALPGASAWLLAASGAIALYGLACAVRRPAARWALGGLLAGGLAFLLLFDVPGTAADFLPVVAAGGIAGGLAADRLIRRIAPGIRPALRLGMLGGAAIALGLELREAPRIVRDLDASPFLRSLDMPTLPPGTVIFSAWRESPPLRYAQYVLTRRTDIRIINARPDAWLTLAGRMVDEPRLILFTREIDVPPGTELVEYRNLWCWRSSAGTPD